MKRLIIIGGGFAGIAAARSLKHFRHYIETIIIDKKSESEFLPLLPDVISHTIHPAYTGCNLSNLSTHLGFRFINSEVTEINLTAQTVSCHAKTIPYDYLLISSGSETNFFGNQELQQHAYPLDTVTDAQRIQTRCRQNQISTILIAGAGYTGIEIATHLKKYLEQQHIQKNIIIIERAPTLMSTLPTRMRQYISQQLQALRIPVLCDTTVSSVSEDTITLSSGEIIHHSMLIWAAGVQPGGCIQKLSLQEKTAGRLIVDPFLRINGSCYVAGDAAAWMERGRPLRMAVQMALRQGQCAAENIKRQAGARPLKKFQPFEVGYIIPLAPDTGCGRIVSIPVQGRWALISHYGMCVYRSQSLKNKIGILKDLFY